MDNSPWLDRLGFLRYALAIMKLIPLSVWAKNNGLPYKKAKDSARTGQLKKVVQRKPIQSIQLVIPSNYRWQK